MLAVCLAAVAAVSAAADDGGPPRDVDEWHEMLAEAVEGPFIDDSPRGFDLGFYPSFGAVFGPPDWVGYQLSLAVSLSGGNAFSVFAAYGYERGANSESHMATMGWGGVRRLTAGRAQRGFYGKFIRYRRLEDFDHGLHHGVSVGVEHGAGAFGVALEFGLARSEQNHWAPVAQIVVKLAAPVIIPLSRAPGTTPEP
ncbi:MAG: hypothetical protein V2I67_19980 [Thermoanaerobaculales bacterium]|nr:hypothetical protein [Thermoanaerobaculales bacterium]